MYPGEPNPNPDRLVGAPDGYGVGWGPKGPAWEGTANLIVKTALPFTHDGIVAPYGEEVAWNIGDPDNYNQSDTRESLLAEVGYDLVIYGLGYGFNGPFESHAMTTVRVSEDGVNWITVSTWTGDPGGVDPYFENQDGTWKDGIQFNNGGFGACPRTYMVIDLDHPDIIDPATGENMDLPALTGTYNYIWFEGGDLYNDAAVTNGNANFPEAVGANAVYVNHLGIDEEGNDYFPQEQAQQPHFTGAASGLQALKFFDAEYSWPSQAELYDQYHTGAAGEDMNVSDVAWMLTDQTNQNPDTARYNFVGFSDGDEDHAIKRMIYWIDYEVSSVQEPNAPAHVPTDGSYSNNWKTVRGFVSNKDPWVNWGMPDDLEFLGAWLNDPKAGGLGYNVYLTADDFKAIYEPVDGSYRYAAEPPQDIDLDELDDVLDSMDIIYVRGKPNSELANAMMARNDMQLSVRKMDVEPVEIEEVFKKVNWDGVIPAELLASPDFKDIYSQTRFNGTLNVADLETAEDYDLVLFSQSGKENTASVVLMVEEESGTFRQASWISEDQKYLSEQEALEIAEKSLLLSKKPLHHDTNDWKIRLIWNKEYDQSRFQPIYEVSTPFGATVYVLQDGSYFVEGNPIPVEKKKVELVRTL